MTTPPLKDTYLRFLFMEIAEAISLIDYHLIRGNAATTWADFGSGAGLFTNALATLLHSGSKIIAVDKNLEGFKTIHTDSGVFIEKLQDDFTTFLPGLTNLTGILMANSLHFVFDKKRFLKESLQYFGGNETFLIVEYDMTQPNAWVPHPISFFSLNQLFVHWDLSRLRKSVK